MKVLVTGASRGIGAGIARACARHGHDLALVARSGDALEALAAELRDHGVRTAWRAVDVADLDALQQAVDALTAELDGLDAAVANAGVSVRRALLDLDPADWRRMVDANVHGSWNTARACVPHLQRAPRAHLVFVSSISGRVPLAPGSGYAATKYAVTGLAESLFLELRDDGISTTCIFPGSVATRLHEDGPDVDHESMVQPEEVGDTLCHVIAQGGNTAISSLEIRPLSRPRR